MTQDHQPHPTHGELSRLLADRRWVVGLCRRLIGGAADVDDLAQETAARALQAEAMGDEAMGQTAGAAGRARRGRAWLAKAARRVASETRRSDRHRRDRELRHGEDAKSAGSAMGAAMDPAVALARAEFRERVARAVLGLPELEREAVVLRFYEGLGYAEMEASTGARPEALRQRVSRGVSRIKERLGSEDRESGGSWRALAAGLVGAAPGVKVGVKAGTGKLVAAAAWLLCAGAAGALWMLRTPTPSPAAGSSRVDRLDVEREVQLAELRALSLGGRMGLTTEDEVAAATGPAREAASVAVRLVDEATGAPASGQRWHVLRTGDFDRGGRPMPGSFFGGPLYPNPQPLISGVTGDDGMAVFALPADDLIHLVTERSERFARGSFGVEIEDGEPRPLEVHLSPGHALFGRVLDDRGEPYPGAVLVGATYAGEPAVWATSDENGGYRVERLANFPRSFKRVYRGDEFTGELRSRDYPRPELGLWSSLGAFTAGRAKTKSIAPGFSGGDRELDLKVWRPRTLRGVVLDEHGEPVEGARVGLRRFVSQGIQAGIPSGVGFPNDHLAHHIHEMSSPMPAIGVLARNDGRTQAEAGQWPR